MVKPETCFPKDLAQKRALRDAADTQIAHLLVLICSSSALAAFVQFRPLCAMYGAKMCASSLAFVLCRRAYVG